MPSSPAITAALSLRPDEPYEAAIAEQAEAVEALASGAGGARIFLVEHRAVYTAGRAGVNRRVPAGAPGRVPHLLNTGTPVVETDRGGDITWHGPGQLVVYPVLPLKPLGLTLTGYLRALERAACRALAAWGVDAGTRDGLTGIWVETPRGPSKIGFIGVGSRRWITYHGLSLNVTADLAAFGKMVPCGIRDVAVTRLADLLPGPPPSLWELGRAVARELAAEAGFEIAEEAVPKGAPVR